ncbi:TolC family protein [Croceicoccus naphthovorans]|uniref:Agglutination protein n=1 Tax=Croceicoccus naphthovorans TaxID=1348774 RepID=A0A0G3XHV1_9SPHN|nr:TolC family protein [Croceicoccus naphthovorans]AKM10191.1 agglutination protein [Croceicoccus naphthovorans]MBB3990567.1 adhesin transport system outer membrane protein [Croceicoccus naphthovorans]
MKTYLKFAAAAAGLLCASVSGTALAQGAPVSLQEAVAVGVDSNPEISQAQMNKEAIQFERKQAQGLYGPRIDIEGSIGARNLENPTRRSLGIASDWLYPMEAKVAADWVVIDFGRRRGELLRQASRVDGASLRVLERSEFVALQIARQYLDVMLQQRVMAASMDNTAFHRELVGSLTRGVDQGSISIADQQQAEERLQAALVREAESAETLKNAQIRLQSLTGLTIDNVMTPPNLSAMMPTGEEDAIGLARTRNPLVLEAKADVDAARALAESAKGDLYPTIGVDAYARTGDDIDGFKGTTNDLMARAYLKWNIFDSGINHAKYQEMVRRSSEARFRLHTREREAEEDVRMAWNGLQTQTRIVGDLTTQSSVTDGLLESYQGQFNVGRRSLLDVLDAQNTRYNVQVRLETARFSEIFAQYQVLAATNRFLEALSVPPHYGAGETERDRFDYGPHIPAERESRVYPK